MLLLSQGNVANIKPDDTPETDNSSWHEVNIKWWLF